MYVTVTYQEGHPYQTVWGYRARNYKLNVPRSHGVTGTYDWREDRVLSSPGRVLAESVNTRPILACLYTTEELIHGKPTEANTRSV